MEGETAATIKGMGVRRIKAGTWFGIIASGELGHVNVLCRTDTSLCGSSCYNCGRDERRGIQAESVFLLPAESGYRHYNRYTHIDHYPEVAYRRRQPDSARESSRINTIWQLWDTTTSHLVVETEHDIFHRSFGHENVRFYHLCVAAMDSPSRRLGFAMD